METKLLKKIRSKYYIKIVESRAWVGTKEVHVYNKDFSNMAEIDSVYDWKRFLENHQSELKLSQRFLDSLSKTRLQRVIKKRYNR